MKPVIDIISACQTPDVFGPWFRDRATWSAWFCCLKALFGLALDETELATFQKHTGRSAPAPGGYRDLTLVIGRRGGKSLVLSLVAAYLAVFYDWSPYLTGGEAASILIIAADRRQAAVTLG
jgi:hypothetical protein